MPPDNSWYDAPTPEISKRLGYSPKQMRYYALNRNTKVASIKEDANRHDKIMGLYVAYPNISHVEPKDVSEYMKKLSKDNAAHIDIFLESKYSVVWLPTRCSVATHIEIWPLSHSKQKLIQFFVDVSQVDVEKSMQFATFTGNKFQESQVDLLENLTQQGFTFSYLPTHSSHTRLVIK